MPVSRSLLKYAVQIPVMVAGSFAASGCALDDILTGVETDYTIQGWTDDADTARYLREVLDERLREKTKTLADEPEFRARQEDSIEQTMRADLLKALHAKGYYDAKIAYEDSGTPFTGTYDIDYGPKFSIGDIDVLPPGYAEHLAGNVIAEGQALEAEAVLEAQSALYANIQKDRCYFSLDVANRVYLDRGNQTGDVEFVIDAGREGVFGPVAFTGNRSVKESYLRRLVPWKDGGCFRREQLENYKTKLLQTGLFSRADAVLPAAPDADGRVPVTMKLRERAHRTVSAGLTYYSDEGPGGILGWEHRNLFGAAEKLKAALSLSSLKQSLDFDFNKPYFMRMDQSLSLTSSVRRQDTDAFEEFGADFGVALNRSFTPRLTGGTGVNLEITRIDDMTDETTETFGLISLPQTLGYDSRDDKLDPHKGWNLSASAEPFFDLLGKSDPFFKFYFSGSGYWAFGTASDLVLASKVSVGSIWGADVDDIPATERFYAGGGGSVRGYGYQEVGPQEDGDPSGGLSLVTGSAELRGKITDSIGAMAFVDAGSVTESASPEFSDLAVGAGVGLRYYTGFGPIRFDIATPLTQKDELEQNYQFYISIGQAF